MPLARASAPRPILTGKGAEARALDTARYVLTMASFNAKALFKAKAALKFPLSAPNVARPSILRSSTPLT